MKKTPNLMIQGTMSGAGKSLLCAALCRILTQDGYRVAPFKSQNMALNSYITADGLEMGRAQAVQAQAARVQPDVRMNPVLLKPSSDTGSQVILQGKVLGQMPAAQYFAFKKQLLPQILQAYHSLAAEYDIIILEGAGSPAEINLKAEDIVNMGLAAQVDAPVLLAGDIDRGGVFAQLYGTVALLEPQERQRVKGLIVNKFRGDPALLQPGLATMEQLTQAPVLGVVPYLQVDVDDEDSLAPRLARRRAEALLDVAVVRLPRISNFTDLAPLESHPLFGVRYLQGPEELGRPDLILLPGTKSTLADLAWLRQSGLEAAILRYAAAGGPVWGICGGYQMLGRTLQDPQGVEGGPRSMRGLGLLPIDTVFEPQKTRTQTQAVALAPPWQGAALEGYEIHMGRTRLAPGAQPFCRLQDGRTDGCVQGQVLGTYLHGLFDSGALTEALADWLCRKKGLAHTAAQPQSHAAYQDKQFDLLAQGVRSALDMAAVYQILGLPGPKEGDRP